MDPAAHVTKLTSLVLSSGETPEAVCRDCPELLEEVRRKVAELQRVEDEVRGWFPDEPEQGTPASGSFDASRFGAGEVPPALPGYEIESLLGRGGMGVVYRARHLRLNRTVAVKVLIGGAQAGVQKLERFLREAEAIASLQHTHIVQLYDLGEFGGLPYFTMELVEGGSLAQKLAGAPQTARHAAEVVATLAGAVRAAHEHGIVHRDLKPSNVLLTTDGVPKISDFGLARRAAADDDAGLTLTGTPIGTPSYMSPEQAQGRVHELGPATDIYSLGAILYEMLTGRPPFRGESTAATAWQVINVMPVHPTRLNPRVPHDLETIGLKCLEKDPGRRYESARALSEDLNRFLRGEPIAACRANLLERAWMWAQRRPTAAALCAALALVALLSAGLVVGFVRSAQRRAAIASVVREDLEKLAELRRTFRWNESEAVLANVRNLLASAAESVPGDIRAAVDRAAANLELARQLEALWDRSAKRGHEGALQRAGLEPSMDPASAASRVRESELAEALVATLDDWAAVTDDEHRRTWCLDVARLADADPTGWGARIRDRGVWADRSALVSTLRAAPIADLPPSLLVAVSERLHALGDVDDAIEFLQFVDREHPGEFSVNYHLGRALMDKRSPAEAVAYYRTAFALKPRAGVCSDLGFALKAAGRLDEAIACYEQAIRLEPQHALSHLNLGVALKSKGDADGALAAFRRAVEADPSFARAHNNLANALKASGDPAGAIEHFERATSLDPKLAEPHYNLALLLAAEGREDEAIAEYEDALRLLPDLFQAHSNLGGLLADRKQWDEALAHLHRAIELAPGDALSHMKLGKALQAQGEHPDEALHHLREGVRLEPDAGNMHAQLGLALTAQGKLAEAEASLRRALELLPESDLRRPDVERSLLECRSGLPTEDDDP